MAAGIIAIVILIGDGGRGGGGGAVCRWWCDGLLSGGGGGGAAGRMQGGGGSLGLLVGAHRLVSRRGRRGRRTIRPARRVGQRPNAARTAAAASSSLRRFPVRPGAIALAIITSTSTSTTGSSRSGGGGVCAVAGRQRRDQAERRRARAGGRSRGASLPGRLAAPRHLRGRLHGRRATTGGRRDRQRRRPPQGILRRVSGRARSFCTGSPPLSGGRDGQWAPRTSSCCFVGALCGRFLGPFPAAGLRRLSLGHAGHRCLRPTTMTGAGVEGGGRTHSPPGCAPTK